MTRAIGRPAREHPRRPVLGFACARSEISGRRLWELFAGRFGAPENFFERHFVVNYCPLAFLEAGGRNRTPDKLSAGEGRGCPGCATPICARCSKFCGPNGSLASAHLPGDKPAWRRRGGGQDRPDLASQPGAAPAANRDWAGPGRPPGNCRLRRLAIEWSVRHSPATVAEAEVIAIHGAREHNLKNISLTIPRNQFVVVTGLSGSGKSTLAFDLLFAEGQRRFLDSMNVYARQFIEQLARPEVDLITGIPPSVSIEQRHSRGGGKSTVATVTEVYHFVRLLFARLGTQFCPQCQCPVQAQTRDQVGRRLEEEMKQAG